MTLSNCGLNVGPTFYSRPAPVGRCRFPAVAFLRLRSRIPTATTKVTKTYVVPPSTGSTYTWYYDRLWLASTTSLLYYAPEYRNLLYNHGPSSVTADATIVTFMPALGNMMWVVGYTSTSVYGSQFIPNADSRRGEFELGPLKQELWTPTATKALTLDGKPVVSNTDGVFMFDGRDVTELTRPVRDSLGSFSNAAITADYEKRFIVGTSKFVIDTAAPNGDRIGTKLHDYGTSGFRFTTRTLAQAPEFNPFEVSKVAFIYEHTNTSDGELTWQTQVEERAWHDENDVRLLYEEAQYSRKEIELSSSSRNCRRFALRINSMDSNIKIREIHVLVGGYGQRATAE